MNPVREQCELLCEVGSGAHGLALEGTDDHDEMGVYIEPQEYVIGLYRWETSVIRTHADGTHIREGERSRPGDTDLTIYSLRKWVSLALNGNPTIIGLMFSPTLQMPTEVGHRMVTEGPEHLLSRRALDAYLGYLKQQKERLLGIRGQKRTNRPELISAYGYDTKYASHALRLGIQGIELAETGALSMPMQDTDREYLLDIRRGEVALATVIENIEDAEDELLSYRNDKTAGVLPAQPDRKWANDFLLSSYAMRWGGA